MAKKKTKHLNKLVLNNFKMDVRFNDDYEYLAISSDQYTTLEELDGKNVTLTIEYDASDEIASMEKKVADLQKKIKELKGE